ncbi:endonuclease/exonuclease/phosphatase family protein [Streptomyces turgidiscabies]|uniref:Endonuclease/exonuclease/phosphatase family protein n=1 Tax=Streptomyces turgidiscabies (strain Car8) TaxID=698760 RepID=L7EUU3_STRT8|nr:MULTISPECIES: endonuclease/exonuclease/phosphatase family protein [Streptomyces]ELP62827.1 endonuclease/exonuclease/phosphatase family protein [Streptomyces turgidiscabies Car8]MDX3493241.1 endonuclease/exonuclease/phosphatase family protein [Streptomyces turgidiscabies]GAQ70542.1 endonuclease/exonuclease/phosphatase family protein [Streptomyces turgidiscabies]
MIVRRDRQSRGLWEYGLVACAVGVTGLLALHSVVPNRVGRLGSALETFLPWLGVAVPFLGCLALVKRSAGGLVACLLPALAWLWLFGGLWFASSSDSSDLTVVQHNIADDNSDPPGTAQALLATGADLVAVQELTPAARPVYEDVLGASHPHRAVHGTVGLWSSYPLTDVRTVDIRPAGFPDSWQRGLRATVAAPEGAVAVYVVHLPSIRLGANGFASAARDESAALLGARIADDPAVRLLVVGDLNGTVQDRGLDPLTSQLGTPDSGFAFSWPASLPVARIDQVLGRGVVVTEVSALDATGSDHLPVFGRVRLG